MRGWLSNLRGDQSQRDSGSSAAAGNSSSSGAEAPPSTLPQSPPLTRGGNNNNDNENDRRGTGRLTAGRSFRSGGNGGNGDGPANNNTSSVGGGGGGGGGVIQALMAGRGGGAAFADAEMERKVSISARNLGDGVSRIVLAARMGGGSSGQSGNDPEEWKVRLLKLLGGSDEDNQRNSNGDSSALTEDGVASGGGNNEAPSDIDILLENSTCERFVLRCVENELPPNLIHCLRLLRVLELQHDHSVAQKQQQLRRSRRSDYGENNDGHEDDLIVPASPLSTQAAAKVSKLLCLLCSDPSVGEQLRPHLFGLLALSGASYPNSGVHIAAAASDVILAFSRSCLSASLVWFLHDRKMIVHMTDDIKELCAMTGSGPSSPSSSNNSSSGNNRCLYGKDAEEKGLWVIAIRTVVHLVSNSCHYQCVELLKDYDSAGGYHVLAYAISNSSMKHVPKLLELVTALVCCKIGATSSAMSSTPSSQEHLQDEGMLANYNDDSTDLAEAKMAMNTNAFEIMDDLMIRSLKLIVAYKAEHDGRRPDFSSTSDLTAMTDFAVKYAWDMTMQATTSIDDAENDVGVDLTSELLVTTLQLYSDHAKNFDLIESEYHMLSHYILGFPAFSDVSVKVFSLKTLEYVCTGLAGANTFMPLRLVTELFISLCKHLLKEAASIGDEGVAEDDEAKAKAMEDSALDLQLLCETLIKLLEFDEKVSEVMLECGLLGPKIDDMLDLLFAITGADLPDEGEDVLISNLPRPSPSDSTNVDDIFSSLCRVLKVVVRHPRARSVIGERGSAAGDIIHCDSGLNTLLMVGILYLGDTASRGSLDVFETMMAKSHDGLLQRDMKYLIDILHKFADSASEPTTEENVKSSDQLAISRQGTILDLLKSILATNESSQEVFRVCCGFECVVRLIFSLEGIISVENINSEIATAAMKLLKSAFALLATATGDKGEKNSLTPSMSIDVLSDHSMSSTALPYAANLLYLRSNGFYVEFASAIAAMGIFSDISHARSVMNLALELIHPRLVLTDGKRSNADKGAGDNVPIRNADATRLVLGIAIRLPTTDDAHDQHKALAKNAFDELLRLCANDMAGSSLSRLASSGLCGSLTSQTEFAHMLEDRSHFLYSRFVLLLRRIAAFSMTYNDFVSLLRCVAGPILLAEDEEVDKESEQKKKRIRLAVISSSVQAKKATSITKSEAWHSRETGFCNRLETLSVIAERGDRVARCELGGDSLNSVAMYMQKIPLEDRIYKLAEDGRMKFIEIESVDASAKSLAASSSAAPQSTDTVWSPLVSTGFTYCCWLRQHHPIKDGSQNSLFVFDISSPPVKKSTDGSGSFPYGSSGHDFFSFWYDVTNQRFCVLTSSNSRGDPTCFPISPLPAGVWHHVQLSYQAPKRSMLGRKAVLTLFIDGRPVESEAKVDAFNLPPTARVHIGVPNPVLASSGIVRGNLPLWDLGPALLVSTVLGLRDATAMYTAGPDFPGLFWGDRPQRLSLAAAATAAFVMLAENGEKGSVAGALRRRKIPSMEAVGHVMRERGFSGGPIAGPESDSLSAVGLLSKYPIENVVFGFRASSSSNNTKDNSSSSSRRHFSRRLVNISRINSNTSVSTDAIVYGYSSIISPNCFAENVQWIGGPNILMPIVNATQSASSLALSLRMIRESVRRHPPNLEMLQAGGGYRMLALLLRQKRIMDASVLDQCFAFAVHGFVPGFAEKDQAKSKGGKNDTGPGGISKAVSHRWVFADLDAMKYLLLNHQVWDLNGAGPELPLRLLAYFNGLVVAHSTHAAFNSRRLHLLGIIRWTLHLMLEATELYAAGASAKQTGGNSDIQNERKAATAAALKNGWYAKPPLVSRVAAGCDPGVDMLLSCKTLLRRVLTFMLTPGDLEAIAGAAIYTVSITGGQEKTSDDMQMPQMSANAGQEKLAPGAVARVYLLRLLEELVVDGVNEIVADDTKTSRDAEGSNEAVVEPHSGGGSSTGQTYLGTMSRKKGDQRSSQGAAAEPQHPKHQEAQIFLSAFAGILTPVWFACILEGCREEASASAVLRLMILMIQNSRKFALSFEQAGGFAPLVLSIPKFSICPSIIMSMLSNLLHAPILHMPCFATLEPKQLCDVFDAESDAVELINNEAQGSLRYNSDPSCGIFALLAECLGRNIQLASFDNETGKKARDTNKAVLQLLSHRHAFSPTFQKFCRTPDFLEPLAQALCLVHDEKLQQMQTPAFGGAPQSADEQGDEAQMLENKNRPSQRAESGESDDFVAWPDAKVKAPRRGSLCEANVVETPTERFVGKDSEGAEGSGIGMVQLLHLVLSHAVFNGPFAAPLVSALFRSFPIHASPDQVEAFHLVLIEHCRTVVEDALQRGEPIAIANCIGVSSVLLDRLMAGFFTSEPVFEAVHIAMLTLNSLTASGTYASRTLANVDQNLLVADSAHVARLTCLTALQRSRPMGAYDTGDDDLKLAVLTKMGERMRQLLLVPSNLLGGGQVSQVTMRNKGGYPTPPPNSRFFPLWQSASLSRCCPPSFQCTYPDLTSVDEPDRAFVVALMADIHSMLIDKRRDIREEAVVVVVSLLQRRRGIMSELLITDIRGEHRMETVDLMNRGGFGALLVAHEATTITEKDSSEHAHKYASFFEWLERNQGQVAAVFHGIHVQASRVAIPTNVGAATPEEAIENEQKVMLLKLTSQDSSDRTILGGLERAALAQRSHGATAESHALWKRQGFDDLSSGAMQWKFLLRQLKGSCTIWEGGSSLNETSLFAKSRLISSLLRKRKDTSDSKEDKSISISGSNESVKRWKLDLTEGYERQRRRMLPNYEFHGLYNIDENADNVEYVDEVGLKANQEEVAGDESNEGAVESNDEVKQHPVDSRSSALDMEVTADLLKKMKLEKIVDDEEDDLENMEDEDNDYAAAADDALHAHTTFSVEGQSAHANELESKKAQNVEDADKINENDAGEREAEVEEPDKTNISASSYDLITGLLKAGDWPEKSYNVNRCTGLEVRKALLLWCRNAIYVVDGFEQTDGEGLKGKINRLKKVTTSFQVNIRQHGAQNADATEKSKAKEKGTESTEDEITYQHRSQRIAFGDLYSVYRRRYQLQQNALEFYDVHRNGTLIAFSTNVEREEVLSKVLATPLPSSIFSSSVLGGATSINYKKFMNNLRAKITSQWVHGKMSNFDFIMHMNSFAGRTYNDLTQYPVFPWVLADYDSEELDLNDPNVYRDFSKPMGGQNEKRAVQFRDRYEALEQSYEFGDGPPPFHYGTHYSCAAYVLYYLMRLEPFSRLALSLQGGKFDVADRLFHNIGASWSSASSENLQDVRELIPEFFYLPDFLVNSNMFDFGTTQLGKTVHDSTLPRWAKGDPKRFIRIHRQALESDYVSRNLHQWLDLVFGFKQRGKEAVTALNTFVHVTYEGQVDLESITDPVERESIIAQIQNFGQTPSRLERKAFPPRVVLSAFKEKGLDFNALASLAALTPPFCVVGAPHRVYLRVLAVDTCKVGMAGQMDSSVGDLCHVKGQLLGVGRTCALILPSKKYYRFGGANHGVSVHVSMTSARYREVNKVLSVHDGMHRGPISVAKPSLNGLWLLTGCIDSTVRVWKYNGQNMQLQATLCGHDGGKITCLDISTTFGSIVTGGSDGKILVWDLRTLTFLRTLHHPASAKGSVHVGSTKSPAVKSVSINHKNGNIVTLLHSTVCVFDINGNLIAKQDPGFNFEGNEVPSCAISTDCPEWMESGIVAVAGHMNGDVSLWSIDYDTELLVLRHILPERVHSCPITALRVSGDRQDTLLIGDKSGKMSACETVKLEQLNASELESLVVEMQMGDD
ncbi:BEACH domain-containing protein [Skeletonema marinoi]|uniref:BEACH domain-containing protein n=2 Tax=Skeletonema marinoi TaxID=267567 RepID=A0AAD9D787_9STRA|nr:BEACH domain-containing protein [Skeletonema marinoi]